MKFIKQTELSKKEKEEILTLWNAEYPEKLNYRTLTEFEKLSRKFNRTISYFNQE